MTAKILTVYGAKGGIGRTSINLALMTGLSNTLALGLDSQANLEDSLPEPENNTDFTIADVLSRRCSIEQAIKHTRYGDFIASDLELARLNVPANTLKDCLKPVMANYDYILCDLPPTVSPLTMNALTASTHIVLLTNPDKYSIRGIEQAVELIEYVKGKLNPDLEIAGILVNRYSSRSKVKKQLLDVIRAKAKNLDVYCFESVIRDSSIIPSAQLVSQSVFDYSPKAPVTLDIKNFIMELERVLS